MLPIGADYFNRIDSPESAFILFYKVRLLYIKTPRLIASPAFASANIFDDNLAAIQVHKSRLVLNRPVYVGMSILDLSKHLLYDFYYNQLRGSTVTALSYCTQTRIRCSSRSRQRMCTRTWPSIQTSMTRLTIRKTTRCTARRGRMSALGSHSLLNMLACGRRCTQSSRPLVGETSRKPRV